MIYLLFIHSFLYSFIILHSHPFIYYSFLFFRDIHVSTLFHTLFQLQVLAENAQKDLDEVVPALDEAMKALQSLNKKDLGEIKAYTNPPELVETVLQAVMILRQSEPSWQEAKRQLGDTTFIHQLIEFDRDNMSDKGQCVYK